MAVSFVYGRLEIVDKPDAGIGERDERFIVENLTNTEALSVTVILMNNIIALIVSFFIMFIYKISYVGTAYSRKFNISIGTITIITAMIVRYH